MLFLLKLAALAALAALFFVAFLSTFGGTGVWLFVACAVSVGIYKASQGSH